MSFYLDSTVLQRNLLAVDVLHVVVEGRVVGHPPILTQRHVLLLPVLN